MIAKPSNILVTSDGKSFITGSWDKTIKFWSLEDFTVKDIWKQAHYSKKLIFFGCLDSVANIVVTDDESVMISASNDNSIKMWELENLQLLFNFENCHSSKC